MSLAVVRLTFREIVSRRVAVWAGVLSAAFLALFAFGFSFLYGRFEAEVRATGDELELLFAGTLLTILGLYVVSFLGSFLALIVSAGSVSADVDSGALQAVLARPLARRSWLLQRWAGLAVAVAVYVLVMGGALLGIARLIAGYTPNNTVAALLLMAGQAVFLLTLGLVGSTRLPTVANGVVAFSLFGLAWLAGIVEFIGSLIPNSAMVNLGIVVSLLVPSDALWRGASFYAQIPAFTTDALAEGGLPFAATSPPTGALLAWAAAELVLLLLLAVRWFGRRDL